MKYKTQWNLEKYFYSGFDDPDFIRDQNLWKEKLREFIKKYKNIFHTFHTSEKIIEFYDEYTDLICILEKPLYFSYYNYSQDIHNADKVKKYIKLQSEYEKYIKKLDFIQEAWKKIGKETLESLLHNPKMLPYKNDIASIIENLPHIWNETKEKSESMKNMNIEKIQMKYQEINNSDILQEEKNKKISTLYHKLCLCWSDKMKQGNYGDNPMALRNRQEQLPDDFVDFFLSKVWYYIPQYQDFLRTYTPSKITQNSYNLQETIHTYLDVVSEISPNWGAQLQDVFVWSRADLLPKSDKYPWAFSSYRYRSPAFVSLHFCGDVSSVFTFAHEMGHILHGTLSQQQKSPVYYSPFVLAETAAILSEILYFDRHLSQDEKAKNYFINSLYTSIFYQLQITLFEKEGHKLSDLEKYDFSYLWKKIWNTVSWDYFSSSQWENISHIFHTPFYCYSYIFGAIAALWLFLEYKNKNIQIKDIVEFYSSGGSSRPLDLLRKHSIDLYDDTLYDRIFTYLQSLHK